MKVQTMQDLYVLNLRDLYSAETQLTMALPKVCEAAGNSKLTEALKKHLEETKEQVSRLETIFKNLGEDPEGHECAAMKGLVKETDEVLEEVKDPEVRDAALIGAAQRVEHYEIAAYGTAKAYAQQLGMKDDVKLLDKSLQEEQNADTVLNEIALKRVNIAAGDDAAQSQQTGEQKGNGSDAHKKSADGAGNGDGKSSTSHSQSTGQGQSSTQMPHQREGASSSDQGSAQTPR